MTNKTNKQNVEKTMGGKSKGTSFKRGQKKVGRKTSTPVKELSPELGHAAQLESAKDLEQHPMAVERIRHLQRQADQAGVSSMKGEKLAAEQQKRNKYNVDITDGLDHSKFSGTLIPKNMVVIRLLMKPIFELNGFLKPDLIKQRSEGGNISYQENRFPYLEAGVIVNENGIEELYGENDYKGALVSLRVNTKLHKYIYFIDKTDINPNTFEGYIICPVHEIESILCLQGDDFYPVYVQEVTGISANKKLQYEVEAEQKALDETALKAAEAKEVEPLTVNMIAKAYLQEDGTLMADGSHN